MFPLLVKPQVSKLTKESVRHFNNNLWANPPYTKYKKEAIPYKLVHVDHPHPELTVGDYPRTEEDRIRAARKYNLIPEDYEPYDEDDGFGDYPKLPAVGDYNRDWYDDFDDPSDNRFYGETLHLHYDLYMWERVDPLDKIKPGYVPLWKKAIIFAGICLFVPVYKYTLETNRIHFNHPWKVREFGYAKNRTMYKWPTGNPPPPHH